MDRAQACQATCIDDTYGPEYYLAGDLNPLAGIGPILEEVVSGVAMNELEHGLKIAAQRNAYGDSKNLPLGRSPAAGLRQAQTLSQARLANGIGAVVGAGAFGFQLGANAYCGVQCLAQ